MVKFQKQLIRYFININNGKTRISSVIKENTSSELEVISSMFAANCNGVRTGFQKLLVSDSGADRLVRRCDYSGHSVALLPKKAYVSPPKSVRIAAQAGASGLPLLR